MHCRDMLLGFTPLPLRQDLGLESEVYRHSLGSWLFLAGAEAGWQDQRETARGQGGACQAGETLVNSTAKSSLHVPVIHNPVHPP